VETGAHYPVRLDALPPGWRSGYVGEFSKEIEPGFASGEHNQTGSGVPHLRPMNIDRGGKIDLSVTKFVAADKDHRRLAPGDVLFNNTNSPELVGKTTVMNQSGEFAFSNHMTRIRFEGDVLPKFAALQLHFLWMRGYFRYNCVKHVNQASVSSRTLAQAVPFVWAPIDEQQRIVDEIDKQFSRLDEAVTNLKRVKANLKRYKAAVLKAAVKAASFPLKPNLHAVTAAITRPVRNSSHGSSKRAAASGKARGSTASQPHLTRPPYRNHSKDGHGYLGARLVSRRTAARFPVGTTKSAASSF